MDYPIIKSIVERIVSKSTNVDETFINNVNKELVSVLVDKTMTLTSPSYLAQRGITVENDILNKCSQKSPFANYLRTLTRKFNTNTVTTVSRNNSFLVNPNSPFGVTGCACPTGEIEETKAQVTWVMDKYGFISQHCEDITLTQFGPADTQSVNGVLMTEAERRINMTLTAFNNVLDLAYIYARTTLPYSSLTSVNLASGGFANFKGVDTLIREYDALPGGCNTIYNLGNSSLTMDTINDVVTQTLTRTGSAPTVILMHPATYNHLKNQALGNCCGTGCSTTTNGGAGGEKMYANMFQASLNTSAGVIPVILDTNVIVDSTVGAVNEFTSPVYILTTEVAGHGPVLYPAQFGDTILRAKQADFCDLMKIEARGMGTLVNEFPEAQVMITNGLICTSNSTIADSYHNLTTSPICKIC